MILKMRMNSTWTTPGTEGKAEEDTALSPREHLFPVSLRAGRFQPIMPGRVHSPAERDARPLLRDSRVGAVPQGLLQALPAVRNRAECRAPVRQAHHAGARRQAAMEQGARPVTAAAIPQRTSHVPDRRLQGVPQTAAEMPAGPQALDRGQHDAALKMEPGAQCAQVQVLTAERMAAVRPEEGRMAAQRTVEQRAAGRRTAEQMAQQQPVAERTAAERQPAAERTAVGQRTAEQMAAVQPAAE